jgi:uridine kinase
VDDLESLRETVTELLAHKQPVLLAIDGFGGSGKTTLARAIQSDFPGSAIITLDDFATDTTSGADRKRFLSQVLIRLFESDAAHYQRFNWREKALADWITIEPIGLIIIEGVSVLGEDFNFHYDVRVWIDCPFELASQRMKERDKNMHNPQYFNVWEKEDREYGKTEPWKRADLIIPVRSQTNDTDPDDRSEIIQCST